MDYNKNSENTIILRENEFESIFDEYKLRRLFFQNQFEKTFTEENFNEMIEKFNNLKSFIEDNAKINENDDYIIPKNNEKIIDKVNDYLQYLDKNPELAMLFIRLGVDTEKIKTKDGKTALHLAAMAGDKKMVEYLVDDKRMDINVKDNNNETPIFGAVKRSYSEETIEYIINMEGYYTSNTKSFLHTDLSVTNKAGETIAHCIIKSENIGTNSKKELINTLIDKKRINVNAKNKKGQTLLHYATKELLINDLNNEQYDNDEEESIYDSNNKPYNDEEESIYDSNNKPYNDEEESIYDSNNKPCNYEALELIKNLVKRGADINAKDDNGNTLTSILKNGGLIKENLEELGDLKLEEWSKKVPFYAIIRGDLELAKDIIDSKKLNIKELTMNGRTLMHCAVKHNNTEAIEYLVDKGLDIDTKDRDEKTALYYAIKYGKKEAIELLISKGADLSIAENSTINSIILDKDEKIIKKAIKTLKKIKKDYDYAKDSIKIKQIKEATAFLKASIEPKIENTQSI